MGKSKGAFAQLIRFLGVLCLAFTVTFAGHARAEDKKEDSPIEARQVVGNILASGLVGGILGLSTLSFYSTPQDHIRNITIGAGVGMIIAVVWVTTIAASSPIKVDEEKAKQAIVLPNFDGQRIGLAAAFQF